MQALRNAVGASKTSLERSRAAAQAALQAVDELAETQSAVAGEPCPGIQPDMHEHAYSLPPAPLTPLTNHEAREYLRGFLGQLQTACNIVHMQTFLEVQAFAEHVSRTCDVPLVRAIVFLQLAPEGISDEDELPPWAPSTSQFVHGVCIPSLQLAQVCAPLTLCRRCCVC